MILIIIFIILIILIIILKNKENFNIIDSKQLLSDTYIKTNINASELTNTNILDTQNFSAENFIGIIVAWSGSIATIPTGWALCDGSTYKEPNNNDIKTPDLRSRFILGASPANTEPIMVKVDENLDTIKISTNEADTNIYYLTPQTIGTKGGVEKYTLTYEEFPSHAHDVVFVGYDTSNDGYRKCSKFRPNGGCDKYEWNCTSFVGPDSKPKYTVAAKRGSGYAHSSTGLEPSGESKPHENLHPYYTLAFIIKIS